MGIVQDIAFRLALEIVKPAVEKTKTYFSSSYNYTIDYLSLKIRALLMWVVNSEVTIFTWVRNEINEAVEDLQPSSTDTSGLVGIIYDMIMNAIRATYVTLYTLQYYVTKGITDWFNSVLKSTIDYLKERVIYFYNILTYNVRNFLSWINNLGQSLSSWIYNLVNSIVSNITSMVQNLTIMVNNLSNAFASVLNNITTTINNIVSSAINAVRSALLATIYSIRDVLAISISELGETVRAITPEILGYVDRKIDEAMEAIGNIEIPLLGDIMGFFDDIKQTIFDGVGFLSKITGLFDGSYVQPPEVRENIDKRKEIQERIKRLISEL